MVLGFVILELQIVSVKLLGTCPKLLPKCFSFKSNCLPPCTDLDYSFAQSYTEQDDVTNEKYDYHESKLSIYFKSNYFMKLDRNELYGTLDFLGSFGGLLGLFTGFSLMSLIEILYFLSIRIYVNKRLYRRWWGPAEDHSPKNVDVEMGALEYP